MKHLRQQIETIYERSGGQFGDAERKVITRFYKSHELRKPVPESHEREQEVLLFAEGRAAGLAAYKKATGDRLKGGETTVGSQGSTLDRSPESVEKDDGRGSVGRDSERVRDASETNGAALSRAVQDA